MRTLKSLVALLAGALLLTGCQFDVYDLPLPGGANVGSNPITVQARFRDVLDLVPKSSVKVNDVTVGQVTDIQLDGYTALVTMQVRNTVDLPANADAEISQTSLLGEKYVALSAPTTGATGRLASGDVIPLSRTGRNPEVEEVLGALSLVLNGGGVAQLKTIATELNKTLGGREDDVRSLLDQIRSFMGQLDQHRTEIVHAIDSLNRLAISVRHQQGSIDQALDELPSALTSLNQQRSDLVRMLHALDRLGGVGVRVIRASKGSTIRSLQLLDPVLNELARSGNSLVNSFSTFLTYPFVDQVVGRDPQVARNLHMGDYMNLSVRLDLDLRGLTGGSSGPPAPLPSSLAPTVVANLVTRCLRSGSLTSKPCQRLLATAQGLSKLKEACTKKRNADTAVCRTLNQIPGLPNPGGSGAPSVPSLPLPSLPGLGRAAVDETRATTFGARGPTLRQLTRMFDPALVKLLVPGMVTR